MIAGHFTTALVAKRYHTSGSILFFLIASQLLDILWLIFHYLGWEVTEPNNFMHVALNSLQVEMTYSHDVIPVLGWTVLTILFGRLVFKNWRTGLIGGFLVFFHAIIDYIGAYSHHVFGPHTPNVTTRLYYNAPNLAVLIELLFLVAMMFWVVRLDKKAGVKRGRGTWIVWILIFIGGTALLFLTADTSIADRFGLENIGWMSGTTVPFLFVTYFSMIFGLSWANKQPTIPISEQ